MSESSARRQPLASSATAIAAELLDRAATASERQELDDAPPDVSTCPPIAEDAEDLGGSLPADAIARREAQGQ